MVTSSEASIASMRAAEALRFSPLSFDPSAPRHQPSVLLLTQNVGGIESVSVSDDEEVMSPTTINTSFFSAASRLTAHEDRRDVDETAGLSEEIQRETLELIADLRAWVHQAAFAVAQGSDLPARGSSSPSDVATKRLRQPLGGGDTIAAYATTSTPPQLDVVVLHFQEIGGKYANATFTAFFEEQIRQHLLPEAGWCSGLLTDRPGDASTYTAVGTVVFLSPRVCPIASILVLPHRAYIPVLDDPASYGGAGSRTFHSAKFANAGNSRKGFVLTSLRLGSTPLHCCNLHLFNDVSNKVALEGSPSVYVQRRAEAFLEAAAECLTLTGKDDPLFFFGDMNLRLDGKAVAAYVKSTLHVDILAEAKALRAPEALWTLFDDPTTVRTVLGEQFDLEPRQLVDRVARDTQMELAEMPVRFAPTYLRLTQPYLERRVTAKADTSPHSQTPVPSLNASRSGRPFARTRLPAWCDRIFFNPAGLEMIAGGVGIPADADASADSASAADPKARYIYDALHLCHTDHDGVFLLF